MVNFYTGWRTIQFDHVKTQSGLHDIYEFGVFSGQSMGEYISLCAHHKMNVRNFWGFDSFEGVPKEMAEPCYNEIWDPDISPYYKAFNAKLFFGVNTVNEAVAQVKNLLTPALGASQKLELIPGFYDQSLTDDLPARHKMGKALIVDIDVDIYSSAKTAMHWLFRNELVDVGTYFFYDDWGGTPGHNKMLDGESRAHREISEEFDVEWVKLAEHEDAGVRDAQTVWQITKIGNR